MRDPGRRSSEVPLGNDPGVRNENGGQNFTGRKFGGGILLIQNSGFSVSRMATLGRGRHCLGLLPAASAEACLGSYLSEFGRSLLQLVGTFRFALRKWMAMGG